MSARRSHPPTLLTLAERSLRTECGVGRGDRVLVAVSGGGDSQALLSVMARLGPKLGFEAFAHGVDHGLRPEAARELDLAEALARETGVPFSRSKLALRDGGNLMARARSERYRALRERAAALGCASIATAHHADDRAETVLLRLLRGAGPRGLAVLPPRAGDLIRPLIRARRTDVQYHLERHGIAFASDPSNGNRRFARVRVRLELLPLAESLSPQLVRHLCALADQLAAPDPEALSDSDGNPVLLSRAHRAGLARLLERGGSRGAVALPGGRRITLEPGTGRPIVSASGPRQGAVKARKSD